MEQIKLDRISELYHKSQNEGLTDEEKIEQQALRQEYLDEIRVSFTGTLEHTVIQYPDGTRKKVERKK